MKNKGILAIDFDNTIAETEFPTIIGPVKNVGPILRQLKKEGWFIIINTCRGMHHEKDATEFLNIHEIPYDLVNKNHPDLCELFVYDCRKISADIYIDDKNLDSLITGINWLDIYTKITKLSINGFKSMLDLCVKK